MSGASMSESLIGGGGGAAFEVEDDPDGGAIASSANPLAGAGAGWAYDAPETPNLQVRALFDDPFVLPLCCARAAPLPLSAHARVPPPQEGKVEPIIRDAFGACDIDESGEVSLSRSLAFSPGPAFD